MGAYACPLLWNRLPGALTFILTFFFNAICWVWQSKLKRIKEPKLLLCSDINCVTTALQFCKVIIPVFLKGTKISLKREKKGQIISLTDLLIRIVIWQIFAYPHITWLKNSWIISLISHREPDLLRYRLSPAAQKWPFNAIWDAAWPPASTPGGYVPPTDVVSSQPHADILEQPKWNTWTKL